jgi:hypothetical protein
MLAHRPPGAIAGDGSEIPYIEWRVEPGRIDYAAGAGGMEARAGGSDRGTRRAS